MSAWTRRTVDTSDEQILAMGMVVSDIFLSKMQDLFNPNFFINDSLKTICLWCMSYYKEYQKAPKDYIQDIYNERKFGIDKADAKLIEEFLTILNKRFVDFEGPVNDDYFLSRSKKYFTKQNLKVRAERVRNFLELDKIDEAEAEMSDYKEFSVAASPAISPFDKELMRRILNKEDRSLFQYPGALGQIIGPIERGCLYGVLGLFKRGKSYFLVNTMTLAASFRRNALLVSLEMESIRIAERIIRNIGTFTKPKDQFFPCFDCEKNQKGSCNKSQRVNEESLLINGKKPKFDPSMTYKPCTVCRIIDPREFEVATWFEKIDYPDLSIKGMNKATGAFTNMFGDNIRMLTYPKYSATIRDIERDIRLLEEKEMFICDIIGIDQPSNLKPEDPREKRVQQIDQIWMRLSQMASERQCAVFAPSQGTRGAIYKANTDQTDIAEWIGILGHVDGMITLNQTKMEKIEKLMRVGMLVGRHDDYAESQNALLLTNFGAGQFWAGSILVSCNDDD